MSSDPNKCDWPFGDECGDDVRFDGGDEVWIKKFVVGAGATFMALVAFGVILGVNLLKTPPVASAPAKPVSPETIQLWLLAGCFVGIWILVALNAAILWILLRRRGDKRDTADEPKKFPLPVPKSNRFAER